MRLDDLAPRIARAYRAEVRDLALARERRRTARKRLLKAEWLVAHRDLQLQRAQAIGRRKYIAQRAAKLTAAREELRKAQDHARRVGA